MFTKAERVVNGTKLFTIKLLNSFIDVYSVPTKYLIPQVVEVKEDTKQKILNILDVNNNVVKKAVLEDVDKALCDHKDQGKNTALDLSEDYALFALSIIDKNIIYIRDDLSGDVFLNTLRHEIFHFVFAMIREGLNFQAKPTDEVEIFNGSPLEEFLCDILSYMDGAVLFDNPFLVFEIISEALEFNPGRCTEFLPYMLKLRKSLNRAIKLAQESE